MNKHILTTVLFFWLTIVYAQTVNYDWLDVQPIRYVDQLPEDILQTKSIAVIIAKTQEEGRSLANEVHPAFVKSGIDVVGYHNVDDLFTNSLVTEQLTSEFSKREIKYLVVIKESHKVFEIVIASFSATKLFIDLDKPVWKMKSGEIESLSRSLYSQSHTLERRNYLVVDQPEFQQFNIKIRGQRYEAYKPDLRAETLYIQLQKAITTDSTKQYDQNTRLAINNFNGKAESYNLNLKRLFVNYPFPYEFIDDNNLSEEELIKKNVRYLLKSAHTKNGNIRTFLNFREKTGGITEYITITHNESIKRIEKDVPVYKFYIKHLPSKSFYLGTKWDADITWQEALKNHLVLLAAEIEL